ncbi:hypothetical protein HRbin16_02571 [bacterium HR16]|nr:hypothetical protein HRbin16_02571 [bacterium HR16]
MVHDRRVTFVSKWLRRARQAKDEFDRFFSAWIALVVAAQSIRDSSGRHPEEDSDRQRVVSYFLVKKDKVMRALEKCQTEMMWLASRRGTTYGNSIIDTGNQDLRDRFARLSRHYIDGEAMQEDELVTTVAELLNKVRNNVFHGGKVYDDKEDLKLLKNVNPVLLAVLEESEGRTANSRCTACR